ncbi:hypothetical protein [Methylocucumis oryzae]|uniref:hypothetical protein n=1 Tax=Methylocucumis oryzae TaxID=1632867 RepID=UPI000B0D99E8
MTIDSLNSDALLFAWQQRLAELNLVVDFPDTIQTSLPLVWQYSQFVAEYCLRKPEVLLDLVASQDLLRQYDASTYLTRCSKLTIQSEEELMHELRLLRNREMVRIAWRDLAGWAELPETLMDLSLLAEACIQTALDYVYQQATAKRGTPLLSDGSAQQLIVLGMGKLGAYELNFSSDIDLILAYAEDGVLTDRKGTSYGEFFTKVGQSLVKVLSDTTSEGFVFRTDLRLRPFGESGALVMSFDGMEHYYLTQAREWERYAMIKARQVAGDVKTGAQLMAMLHAFVYRRYLDYGTF